MSLYDKASLVLIPSGTKTSKVYSQKPTNGDGDFTFSRSTAATRVNASGNIEKQTGNYMLYSQQIDNAYWDKYAFSVTANQATAPDGTTTADLIDDGTNTGIHAIEENETIGFGGVATISIHAKYVDTQYLVLAIYDTSYRAVAFDIQNGTIGNKSLSTLIPTIEDLGNGWYRCAVTHPTNTRNNPFFTFGLRDDDVAGFLTSAGSNRQAYVWGAQMEDGLVARDYIETTTTAIYGGITDNVPRLDYTDSSCPALLLEPQRTNLITQSEYFADSSYIDNGVSFTLGFLSPDGNLNASKLLEDNTNSIHRFYQTSLVTASPNATISVYVKHNGRRFVLLRIADSGVGRWYDVENGILGTTFQGTPNDSTIESVGNDWYRITISHSVASQARFEFWVSDTESTSAYQGDTTKGVYLYGAQLEAGSYATSYIPTYGSAVTRNADAASKTGVSSLIGQTEGTLFFDVNISRVIGNEAIGTINSGAYANHATIQRVGNTIQFVRNSATQSGATIVTSATITAGRYKLAIAYKSGDTACFLNGTQVSTTQTQTFTNATLNAVKIGTDAIGALPISDSVKQSTLFKERLSNAELATLTTI